MKVLLTGATGYIGSSLTSLALKHGHKIIIASRNKPSIAAPWLPFDLLSDNSITLPAGINAVVHLAANTTHTNCLADDREILAAKKLIKSTQEVGARFIFVSSQTARPDAPSAYGRTKWHIEQEVLSAGGRVVRPGQVYGGELRGLFGMLVKTVKHMPILPAFVPAPMIQPIHVNDLAEGLLSIVEHADIPSGVFCLGAPEPVSFSRFLVEIAQSRLRCWRGFVPVPVLVINALAIALGESLRTRLGLARLRSLFDLPVMDTSSDLKQLGLTLRPLCSGMHPSGNDRRRGLLREGRALLTYVLKEKPGSAVLRRYLRAVEQLREGQTLRLPNFFLNYPISMSLLDDSAWISKSTAAEFSWRLDAATVLAEATPSGACRFLGLGSKLGMLHSLLTMTNAVACDVFWRILRILFFPFIRLSLARTKEVM